MVHDPGAAEHFLQKKLYNNYITFYRLAVKTLYLTQFIHAVSFLINFLVKREFFKFLPKR